MPGDVNSITVYCKILRYKVDLHVTGTYFVLVIMTNIIALLQYEWWKEERDKLFSAAFMFKNRNSGAWAINKAQWSSYRKKF